MTAVRIWLLIAIVVGGAAFMACKSSGNKTAKPTVTQSSSATASSMTPSSSDTTPSSGNGAPNLNDLANNVATQTVKATYTLSSSGAGQSFEGTFTLYSRPPDSRVDFTSQGTTSIFISAGGKNYSCETDVCTEVPVSLGTALPFLAFFTNPQQLSGLVGSDVNHSTKTIAGQDADCYSGSVQGAGGEVCFNSDGMLVSVHGSAGGEEYTMEATSVEGTVSDSDLAPPYPVQ